MSGCKCGELESGITEIARHKWPENGKTNVTSLLIQMLTIDLIETTVSVVLLQKDGSEVTNRILSLYEGRGRANIRGVLL